MLNIMVNIMQILTGFHLDTFPSGVYKMNRF
jgi:hypothetical protein